MPYIMIDPGHGGKDPGAVANGLREKDIVLFVGGQIHDRLAQHGFKVNMTRYDDHFVELSDRARFANAENVDYFLSVHINAGGGTGYEDFVQVGCDNGVTGQIRALIHQNVAPIFAQYGMPDRGPKQADLAVCRETNMAASLIELGFIDSADHQHLTDSNFLGVCVEGVVAALCQAFGVRYIPNGQPVAAPVEPQMPSAPAPVTQNASVTYNHTIIGNDTVESVIIDGRGFVRVTDVARLLGGKAMFDSQTGNIVIQK